MKRLSEVCKLVGVSRRTLQGYNEMGLLCPTEKTEGGYWLYDEGAINKLILIQVFVEVGYERKKVKQLFDNPGWDVFAEFDNVIDLLQDRRKRLDGMINVIQSYKTIQRIPRHILSLMSKNDVTEFYNNLSFTDCWKRTVDIVSEDNNETSESLDEFFFLLSPIAQLRNKAVDDPDVLTCSKAVFDYCKEL